MPGVGLLVLSLARVSVDWSGVSEAVIERCQLAGLENLLLQSLVDEGLAVIREAGENDIAVTLDSRDGQFTIEARRGEEIMLEVVPIPKACDATIQVEVLDRMLRVTRALVALPARTATVAQPAAQPHMAPPPPATWRLLGGAGVVLPSSTGMVAIRLGARYRVSTPWLIGLVLEGSIRSAEGVLVTEPVIAAQALLEVWSARGFAFLTGLEAGLLAHIFSREEGGGGHVDGRFGAIVEGRIPLLGASLLLLPYVRAQPVRQEVGFETAFRATHFGIVIALSVSAGF